MRRERRGNEGTASATRGFGGDWRQVPQSEQRQTQATGMLEENMRYVLLAACCDNESAYETEAAGQTHGIFSYALCGVLRSFMASSVKDTESEATAAMAEANNSIDALNELNWLELFPHVQKRVKELIDCERLQDGSRAQQNPQLVGLRSWRVFGTSFKPVPRFFPAVLKEVNDFGLGVALLTVKIEAGYLHGVGEETKWDLEVIQPRNNRSQAGNIAYTIMEQQNPRLNGATTSLNFIIEKPMREAFPVGPESKMKALQVITWHRSEGAKFSVVFDTQETVKNTNTNNSLSTAQSSNDKSIELATIFEKTKYYAQSILNCAQLNLKYTIELTPKEICLKLIVLNKTVFSSSLSDHLQFLKNVDCFVR